MKPQIILNDYKLFNKIGKGSFGEVYLTQKGNDPNFLATKRMELKQLNDNIKKYLNNELAIMKELNHPNVIRLVNIMNSTNHYYVIMEFCNGGSLSHCLKKYGRPFSLEIIQYFMRQILEGLKYIHSHRIIHRDLKLDNILINFKNEKDRKEFNLLNSEVKIIDFGLSTKLGPDSLAATAAGSPINMDPLILKKYDKAGGFAKLQRYNEKADIWSLGTICYEMLTGDPLYKANSLEELIAKSKKGNYSLPITNNLTNEMISFLNAMLQHDYKNRYSAEELLKHDFIVKDVKDFTQPDLNLIASKINGFNIEVNPINNTTMWNVFNKKDKEQNKDWEIYINGLLTEYKAAKYYFQENNSKDMEKTADNYYQKIKKIKTQFDLGNNKHLINLPKPITPEFIYGCSKEERNNKYNEIISKYSNDKTQLETKINSYDKNTIESNKELKIEYEKDLAQLEQYNKILKEFETNFNNIWTPAPEYVKKSKKFQVEKNYNSNLLILQVKKVDNNQENINLIFTLKTNTAIIFTKEVKLNKDNNFNDKWNWKISFAEWLNLENYYLKIENNNVDNSQKKIKTKISLSKLKSGKGITFNSTISEAQQKIINITINPMLLEGKKYIGNEMKELVDIHFLKPFEGKSPDTEKTPTLNN